MPQLCVCLTRFTTTVVVLLLLLGSATVSAMEYNVSPSDSLSTINSLIKTLVPGDILTFANGTYDGYDIRLYGSDNTGLKGTSGNPITLRGSGDTTIIAHVDEPLYQECILLPDGAQFITIENFQLTHLGSYTQAAIWLDNNVHDIKISSNTVYSITGTGIQLNKNDVYNIEISDNWIHDTGTNPNSNPSNGGYGIWAGGLTGGTGRTTGVHDILIKHNLIHDTVGQEGSCVRLFFGVYSSAVIDNVLFNCPRGKDSGQSEFYGLIVIGSSDQAGTRSSVNTVARNLLFNVGDGSSNRHIAISICAGTLVHNNLVLNSDTGINLAREEASTYQNTEIIHNTVFEVRPNANTWSPFKVTDATANDASSFIIQNNIFSVGSQTSGNGYFFAANSPNAVISNNYFDGTSEGQLDESTQMIPTGTTFSDIFVLPSVDLDSGNPDFMCKGILIDAGTTTAVTDDFDTNTRPTGTAPDVGCYEYNSGTHWAIKAAFKGSSSSQVCSNCQGSNSDSASATLASALSAAFRDLAQRNRMRYEL